MRIRLKSDPDHPYESVKRELGRFNLGLYCSACAEFFALAVLPEGAEKIPVQIVSDGPLLFECPFCHSRQTREIPDMVTFVLTEQSKQKPPNTH